MPPRRSLVQSILQGESPSTWIAIVVASLSLFYFFSRTRRANRRGANGGGGGGASQHQGQQRTALPSSSSSSSSSPPPGASALRLLASGQCVGWSVGLAAECFATADGGALLPGVEPVVRALLEKTELYVFCRVEGAAAEKREALLALLRSLSGGGDGGSGRRGFVPSRLLMCSTSKGYEAFARQLKPVLTVIPDAALAVFLSQFLPYILLVGGSSVGHTKPNVERVSTLSEVSIR